jgi:hypothetical protein
VSGIKPCDDDIDLDEASIFYQTSFSQRPGSCTHIVVADLNTHVYPYSILTMYSTDIRLIPVTVIGFASVPIAASLGKCDH